LQHKLTLLEKLSAAEALRSSGDAGKEAHLVLQGLREKLHGGKKTH
jgi:hypothetical protein